MRPSRGVIATTWSIAVIPFGCRGASAGGGRSDRPVGSPSISVAPIPRSDQPAIPSSSSSSPRPQRRIRTSPSTQVSPSMLNPHSSQAAGESATVSSSIVVITSAR